jgi:hypothetical protein
MSSRQDHLFWVLVWSVPSLLELDVRSLNVKKLETKLLEKSHVLVSSSPCEGCVSLKSKLVHATNENIMLMQDVVYLGLMSV